MAPAENVERKDFLPSEIDAIRRAMLPAEKAAAKKRQQEHGGTAPGKHSRKLSGSVETRDQIGALAGVSGRTVEKIAKAGAVVAPVRPSFTGLWRLRLC